jgi:hypothetical protein
MKTILANALALGLALILLGCASSNPDPSTSATEKPEKGPHGTIAYYISVESDPAGARIEVNGDYVGKTPLKVKIFGDKDGTFHNFGSYDYVLKAYPPAPDQDPQAKHFRTGGWFTQEDMIPNRVYFDFGPAPKHSGAENR